MVLSRTGAGRSCAGTPMANLTASESTLPPHCWIGLEELRPELRRRLARRCPAHLDLDEVLQEALVRAARFRQTLQAPERLTGWVTRIAWNVLRERRRRGARERDLRAQDFDLESAPSPEGEPYAPDESDALLELEGVRIPRGRALLILEQEFAALAGKDRRVLGSYYWQAASCRETAQACGVKHDLVKTRLFRARRRLLRAMRRRLSSEPRKSPEKEIEPCRTAKS